MGGGEIWLIVEHYWNIKIGANKDCFVTISIFENQNTMIWNGKISQENSPEQIEITAIASKPLGVQVKYNLE